MTTTTLHLEPRIRRDSNRPVSVDQLQRAWRAVAAGEFDTRRPHSDPAGSGPRIEWAPGPERPLVAVAGCCGGVGATTLALALASGAGSARLVECVPSQHTGLAVAASAELGDRDGWILGRRGALLLLRQPAWEPSAVPPPEPGQLTVLDLGQWPSLILDKLSLGEPGTVVVLVTAESLPGLRRVELILASMPLAPVWVVSVGRSVRHWPSRLTGALGPCSIELIERQRWATIPTNEQLALRGIDAGDLPKAVLAAAGDLLHRIQEAIR